MSEVSDRYDRVAAGFESRLLSCPEDGWSAHSPCQDWSARDIAVHVVDTHRRVLAALDKTEASSVQPDDDLAATWREVRSSVSAALADRGRAATLVSGMFGEQPFEDLVGRLLCADTLLHTWDLARATGQDDRLDEPAAAAALEFLAPLDDAIRRPGGFGAKLAAPEGADTQTRLLAFAGRQIDP